MFKANKIISAVLLCSSVIAVSTMTGCRTASIPVEVTVPGEFNLSGVSKIAIVDFNSVKGDSVAGIYAADKDTMSIVQRMIATTFCKGKMYQIANLDIEKEIADKHTFKLANKFDAVMYGRVWWQVSPEYRNTYPQKFTLERWRNVEYDTGVKDPITKKPIYATAHVTQNTKDVLETLYYRAWNANLMLSLTLYRLNKDGQIEKITETYAVASQNFIVDNGKFDTKFVQIGADKASRGERLKASTEKKSVFGSLFEKKKKDVSGKFVVVQNNATIPTELQAKLMLAGKLSAQLGNKLTPSKITFNVPCDFEDDKLFNLLKDGAFKATKEYVSFKLNNDLGKKIAEEILGWPTYDAKNNLSDDVADAVEEYKEYLFAMAVSCEALGDYEEALAAYRYVFNIVPEKETALGISRCLFALGMNDRVKEKAKAQKAAGKQSSVK